MKSKFWISFIFSLLLTLLSCWTSNNLMPRVAAEQNRQCEAIALVDKIRGEAYRIDPEGKSEPLAVNQRLCKGDKINIEAKAQVTVICNVNKQPLTFKISSESQEWGVANLCPSIDLCDGNACYRGKQTKKPTENFHIIYPSKTSLTENKPTFRWEDVPDATDYTVTLVQTGKGKIWQKTVKTTDMNYPDREKPLEFGTVYNLTVKAFNRENSSGITTKTTFKMIEKDQVTEVELRANQFKQNDPETIPFLLDIYRRYNLRAKAIADLEKLVDQGNESARIYLELGDLYWQVKRPFHKIKEAYDNSLKLAAHHQNKSSQALAYTRLGKIYQEKGDRATADDNFNKAKECYQEAEDEENAEKVRNFISNEEVRSP